MVCGLVSDAKPAEHTAGLRCTATRRRPSLTARPARRAARLNLHPTRAPARLPPVRCRARVPVIFRSMSRRAPALRALVSAALLAFTAAGTGLPMCQSVVQGAEQACTRRGQHEHSSESDGVHLMAVAVAAAAAHSCHPGDLGRGCAMSGGCPAVSTAAPTWADLLIAIGGAAPESGWAPPVELPSFLAPPPSPPPQV